MRLLWLFCIPALHLHTLELPSGSYQDIFLNGKVLAHGYGPDCRARYEAIKGVLDLYQRPITVLDIGAAEGYFSLRIAHEYEACVVMIGHPEYRGNFLKNLCEANTEVEGVILLSKKISANELTKLSEYEHFDIVLALNVIHNFDCDWKEAYDAILRLGDNVILETPPNGDKGACGQPILSSINAWIDREPFTLLGQFARLHTDPTQKDRLIWISSSNSDYIESNQPVFGIHPATFEWLNGTYPYR